MTTLESSVRRLAGALDALEAKLDDRIAELGAKSEAMDAARLRAETAKTQTAAAADDLAEAIRDIKSLLAETEGR